MSRAERVERLSALDSWLDRLAPKPRLDIDPRYPAPAPEREPEGEGEAGRHCPTCSCKDG